MNQSLGDLLQAIPGAQVEDRFRDNAVSMISCDSREDQPGALFVALTGLKFNGMDFIKDAVARGAIAVAKTGNGRRVGNYSIPDNVAVINIKDPKIFLHLT